MNASEPPVLSGVTPVHITAVCPACENSYKVQPSLRGQPMRCPNPDCRTVFTVPAEEPPAPPKPVPPPNGRRTGSVGDLVPLVQAEAVETPTAKTAPSWQEPPPVRRPANPVAPPAPAPPAPGPSVNDGPREMPPGTWEPPPVRRGQTATPAEAPVDRPAEAAPEEAPAEAPALDEPIPHPPARRVGLVVAALALFVVVVLGGGGVLLWYIMRQTEPVMSQEAEAAYKREQFSQSADLYKQLAEQFPASDKHDSYLLMRGLSDLRNQASAPDPELSAVLDQYFEFLNSHKEPEEALKERAPDLGATVVKLAEGYADRHRDSDDDQGLENAANRLEKAYGEAKRLAPDAAWPELRDRFAKATGALHARAALVKLTRECVARIAEAAAEKSPSQAVRQVRRQLKEESALLPDIEKNPEVVEIVRRVYANHIRGVTYKQDEKTLPSAHSENDETTLLVNASLPSAGRAPPDDDPIVLALVRGVLYGLEETTGETKWALRVGVDVTDLPVRVPATEISPERILVPSADALTLAALDANGERLWEYRLSDKCIGRPLVIGNLAYVPTYDGKVHEIELSQGKPKGVYDLGQHLTSGGALQPGTNLLYFPADDFCVYVLDAKEHHCVAVLYTGHPAGSLRGAPLVLTPDPEEGESWLVLNEADGLDHTQLRVYRLPVAVGREQQAPALRVPEPPLPGWTWFPPSHDGELVSMLGDTGVLGLFGIRQARNLNDPPLFPVLPEKFDLAPAAPARDHGRSEVVEMRGQDFCLLANGRLHRYYLELNAATGPMLEPAPHWDGPPLGSPLHASQVRVRPDGGATLFLVTQPLTRQTCLATAVDDRGGDVLWQRQLGLVCQGEPLELRPPGGAGPPLLLTLDRGGGLFAFDPANYAGLAEGDWREGGQYLFPALDDGPAAAPVLLPGPDGQSAYEIASPGDGKQLVVRRVERTADGLKKDPEDPKITIALSSPLAGTPAVTRSMLVLPLAKGAGGCCRRPLDWLRRAAGDAARPR